MRRIARVDLKAKESGYLRRRQSHAKEKDIAGTLDVDSHWSDSSKTKTIGAVRSTLKLMAGPLESCNYCSHSHGTDIDHFWPKSSFRSRMYDWNNFILCCTECGRIKGVKFPLDSNGIPLLLNPTQLDPWEHLDFDLDTGAITARYILSSNGFSEMGERTVEVLELDRREALSKAYQMAYQRITYAIHSYLASSRDSTALESFRESLQTVSAHGLVGWMLTTSTRSLSPFRELRIDVVGWDTFRSFEFD